MICGLIVDIIVDFIRDLFVSACVKLAMAALSAIFNAVCAQFQSSQMSLASLDASVSPQNVYPY
jgi:hypothetical protein